MGQSGYDHISQVVR